MHMPCKKPCMNIKVNYKLCTLVDNVSYDKRFVFNLFFLSNTRIIYIINYENKLIGIITIKRFLECLQKENENYINKNYFVLEEEKLDILLTKAKKIAEQSSITTAIPVINKEGELLFDLCCCFSNNTAINILYEFHSKFNKYLNSYHLQNDIRFLKNILSEQKILIIGDPKDFEIVFGILFQNKMNLFFLEENQKDGYQLLSEHSNLLIDLTTENHVGRNDIYKICNNGFSWDRFWERVLYYLEHDYINMIYSVLIDNNAIFEGYLKKYIRKICIKTNDFLAFKVIKYLYENFQDTTTYLGLFRQEMVTSYLILNGEIGKLNWGSIVGFLQQISFSIQMFQVYLIKNKEVNFLNLKCESLLYLTEGERDRFQNEDIAEEFFEELENDNISDGIYDINEKPIFYFKNVPYGIEIRQRRRFENDFNLYNDYNSDLVHIENGIRKTCEQPDQYYGTIYVVGVCTIFGWYVEDKYTIPSLIQNGLNSNGKKYRVVNLGSTIPVNYKKMVDKLTIFPEDIVVVLYPVVVEELEKKVPIIEIGDMLTSIRKKKYPQKDVFLDLLSWHCSDYGNRLYAEVIIDELFKYIKQKNIIYRDSVFELFKKDFRDLNVIYDFDNYLLELRNLRFEISKTALSIGCIVMNCNPFTLGHKYLINVARQQVDHLIVFVVEENKSDIPFHDRIEMVRRGVLGMNNVSVIRSGKLIISSATFTEYFVKSHIGSDEKIHFSMAYDLSVFARYIAPELDIQYRFVGEEPLDKVTAQYNQDMKIVLSSFEINVIEIDRKRLENGEIISASKVREALEQGNIDLAKKMLPLTTINYMTNEMGL